MKLLRLIPAVFLVMFFQEGVGAAPLDGQVLFNRDIRPILSDACFQCHGPDANQRKGGYRLDIESEAIADREGDRVITPGDPIASELIKRVTHADPAERMPPPEANRQLSPREIEMLTRWIQQGARYEKHWAFLPVQKPEPPTVANAGWPINPIDRFVLAKLEAEGLTPSPQADKRTLIRRLSFDLTGLPPSPLEIADFLADESPRAYEDLVDRLLKSPRYGERMTQAWLDAARYADTNGYQVDTPRTMWVWRDWVIKAFNDNMPFDRFTIEQLAGDMLPDATLEQRIASGFNRNHRINGEGGIIPEEFLVEYVVDRVETTGTVWLGLTLGCARCHDHKFDPISQKEFFQFFAFFHNVPEKGADALFGPAVPFIKVPDAQTLQTMKEFDVEIAATQQRLGEIEQSLLAAQPQWEQQQMAAGLAPINMEGMSFHLPLDGQIPATFVDGEPAYEAGPFSKAADFDGKRFVSAGDVGDFEHNQPFSFGAWVYANADSSGAVIARMDDHNAYRGYNLYVAPGGVVIVQVIGQWPDKVVGTTSQPILKPQQWHHLMATYNGDGTSSGLKIYVDGKPVQATPYAQSLGGQSIRNKVALTIGTRTPGSRFKGRVTDVRLFSRELPEAEIESLAARQLVIAILSLPADKRTPEQVTALRNYFITAQAPPEHKQLQQRIAQLSTEKKKLDDAIPTTLVMQEMPKARETFVLLRGQYDKQGERVTPALPASLPSLPQGLPLNRLGLAQWLISRENPLTARVTVNRFWEMLFGSGLVKTPGDFGSQAHWPTHPELLDWLASEFMDNGWDAKSLLRTIVTSETYRQSSAISPRMLERDPNNELLSRGPRFRLTAEMIRDNALAASGLLTEKIGGPPVKPYQPEGLWEELASGGFSASDSYKRDSGELLYRRSLYIYWKRTVPPTTMAVFDAPSREICVVQRGRTNTPLQALALLNDVTYVEASRKLAAKVMREGGTAVEDRLAYAFECATARRPAENELGILTAAFQRHLAEFRDKPSDSTALLSVGEAPGEPDLDANELAAYTAVASIILNLDECITKE